MLSRLLWSCLGNLQLNNKQLANKQLNDEQQRATHPLQYPI